MAFVLAYTRFVCEGACVWVNMWAGGCAGVEKAKFLGDGGQWGQRGTLGRLSTPISAGFLSPHLKRLWPSVELRSVA